MEKHKLIARLLKNIVKPQILEFKTTGRRDVCTFVPKCIKKDEAGHILGSCSASALLFHLAWS